MNMQGRYILALLLTVIPLTYSFDDDPYRAWEVVFWGGVTLTAGVFLGARFERSVDYLLVFAYCLVLILQQFFIPEGKLWFGAQYAIVLAAAFTPYFIMHGINWKFDDFERSWDLALRILSLIIVINVAGGRLFGWGEIHETIEGGGRYFGFLGDSISPVITFPLIYFIMQRNFGWAALLCGAMLLTAGKTAIAMLAIVPILFLVIRMKPIAQLSSIITVFIFGIFFQPFVIHIVARISSDPFLSYSWNTRLLSYRVGWEYFLNSPIYGVGINQSMKYIRWDSDALATYSGIIEYWNVYQIHNAFIRTLAETGALGFTILVTLCFILIQRSFWMLKAAISLPPSRVRSLIIASGLWTILFITTYQTTGWFEHGHPQLAWLLMISALGYVAARSTLMMNARANALQRRTAAPAGLETHPKI